jgi:hypothetical protein
MLILGGLADLSCLQVAIDALYVKKRAGNGLIV